MNLGWTRQKADDERAFVADHFLEPAPFDAADGEMRVISRSNALQAPTRGAVLDDRAVGFVLFMHRESRQFEGGTLDLHTAMGESIIIEPSQNSVVFFGDSISAQTGAVAGASGAFIDSRLTLEGCILRRPAK